MKKDNLKNLSKYFKLYPSIKKVSEWLKGQVLEELPEGIYNIDGDNLFCIVQEYMTKDKVDCFFESHKKYIDFQLIVNGTEVMEYTDVKELKVKTPYSDEKDIMFYYGEGESDVYHTNEFAIFFPEDAHKPCIKVNKSIKIKKIVFKLKDI